MRLRGSERLGKLFERGRFGLLGAVLPVTGFSKSVVSAGLTLAGGVVAGSPVGGKTFDLSNSVCAAGLRGGLGDAFDAPRPGIGLAVGVFSKLGLARVLGV